MTITYASSLTNGSSRPALAYAAARPQNSQFPAAVPAQTWLLNGLPSPAGLITPGLNHNSHGANKRYTRICGGGMERMRLGYSLGSLLSVDEVLECAGALSGAGADTVWVPETWGMENFSMLGAISQANRTSRIGSSIVNVYSRSPAAVAMGAATLDTLSRGRLVLGLGSSSVPIVEDFHGYRFEDPVRRVREYVEIVRTVLSTGKANYSGDIFRLKGFSLLIRPYRREIPVYLAAVNRRMVDLAWDVADGVIFYLRPVGEIRRTVARMQRGRRIDVACQLITCVSRDRDAAVLRAKKTLAFYVSVGKVYREFLSRNGFAAETGAIYGGFRESGLASNHEMVTDEMVDALAIAGTPRECRERLGAFREAGVDMPIIQFNPVGDVGESFGLLVRTFAEGG